MKKIAVMQPYIFPYIGYFQLINAVDEFVIFDNVNFIKRGWINRNNILINGEKKLFTVPVSHASSNKLINELEVPDNLEKFEKTIEFSYAKAPFINDTLRLIRKVFKYPDKNLAHFIGNSLIETANYLGVKTKFSYASAIKESSNLKGRDKIISICKKLEADVYINPIGGTELYDKEDFASENIELKFLKPGAHEYKQLSNEFIPGLSLIDVMMFNPPEEIIKMLNNYELI